METSGDEGQTDDESTKEKEQRMMEMMKNQGKTMELRKPIKLIQFQFK